MLIGANVTADVNRGEVKEVNVESQSNVVLPDRLYSICGCESNWDPNSVPRQFNEDGSPLENRNYDKNGIYWSSDWGACQINDHTWDETAIKLGLNYKYNKNDNYKMALHILDVQGYDAWKNSGSCHSK